jgi:hypothetical protein
MGFLPRILFERWLRVLEETTTPPSPRDGGFMDP